MSHYAKKSSTRSDIVRRMFDYMKANATQKFIFQEDDEDILKNNATIATVPGSDYNRVMELFLELTLFYEDKNLILKDLSSVKFDFENCEEDTNGTTIFPDGTEMIWFYAGGDWEDPINFIFYLDCRDRVRAFIPKDGNVFCPKCKHAYGSCHCNPKNQSPNIDPDYNKMYSEIVTKIRTM